MTKHGAPNKGRAWVNFCTTRWSAYEPFEITTIGDELNDTNTDDHNNLIWVIPDVGISCLHDAYRFKHPFTCRWARLDLRCFIATCPVDVNNWPTSSA